MNPPAILIELAVASRADGRPPAAVSEEWV